MKVNEKTINALMEMGLANEWVKGDMHRIYINIGKIDEAYEHMDDASKRHGRLPLNRKERMGGKIWIDTDNMEINYKNISLGMGDEEAIVEIMEDVTGTAETEENKETTYEVCLSNDSCIFDACDGFTAIDKAIAWTLGRNYPYTAHFRANPNSSRPVAVSVNGDDSFSIFNGWDREYYDHKSLAEYLRKEL